MEKFGSSQPLFRSGMLAEPAASPATRRPWPLLQPQWRAFLEGLKDAVIGVDENGRCAFANPAAGRLLGASHFDIIGQEFGRILWRDSGDDVVFGDSEAEFARPRSARFLRDDGMAFDGQFSVHPLRHEGETRGHLVTFWAANAPGPAQAQEGVGVLTGDVAHQLNNMLSPILMAAEVLRSRPTPETLEMAIGIIEASVLRGAEIVARVVTGGHNSERDPMDTSGGKN